MIKVNMCFYTNVVKCCFFCVHGTTSFTGASGILASLLLQVQYNRQNIFKSLCYSVVIMLLIRNLIINFNTVIISLLLQLSIVIALLYCGQSHLLVD